MKMEKGSVPSIDKFTFPPIGRCLMAKCHVCEVKMNKNIDREQQLEKLPWRYGQRGKVGNSRLLNEFCDQYGFERKYAIKLLIDALPKLD
jgi:hypothetical protein